MNVKIKDLTKKNLIYEIVLYLLLGIALLSFIALKTKNAILIASVSSGLLLAIFLVKVYKLFAYMRLKETQEGKITQIKYKKRGYTIYLESKGKTYLCTYYSASFRVRDFLGLDCSFVVDAKDKAYIKTIYQ